MSLRHSTNRLVRRWVHVVCVVAGVVHTGACSDSRSGGGAGPADASVQPESSSPGACIPGSCIALQANCGRAVDSCGNIFECGTCEVGQTCGAAGPNLCGVGECWPESCLSLQAACGLISNGCDDVLSCGQCPAFHMCDVKSAAPKCQCEPQSCLDLMAGCGQVPDRCGGVLECGTCPGGQTCGAGGPNLCGVGECSPKTCLDMAASCGLLSDGCGGVLDCGQCDSPLACGGGGVAYICGCQPRTCAGAGVECGPLDDGCGVQLDCGQCAAGQECGGVTAGRCSGEQDAGATETPPSCQGLPETCGADGAQSCCRSPLVPGGTFNRINDPAYPATVSDFRLDAYEITVGRFRSFVAVYKQSMTPQGAGKNPNNLGDPGWDKAWDGSLPADAAALDQAVRCYAESPWSSVPGSNDNRAIPCITWYTAYAFCIWDGGRMPTEAEWNYAAAGGSEQRSYPWSNPPGDTTRNCSHANTNGCGGAIREVGSTSPTGDGKWGHADLVGNVAEWLQDAYVDALPVPCVDCAHLGAGAGRVMRGAGWYDGSWGLLTSRGKFTAAASNNALGARCARSP